MVNNVLADIKRSQGIDVVITPTALQALRELCLKDLGLISELGKQVNADLPMTAAAVHAFTIASERYGANAAELHVAKRIEDDAKISMRLEGEWTPPWES